MTVETSDIVSLAWLEAVRRYRAYDPSRCAFSTWVEWPVRAAATAEARRAIASRQGLVQLSAPQDQFGSASVGLETLLWDASAADPGEVAATREKVAAVREALGSLPEDQRLALARKHGLDGHRRESPITHTESVAATEAERAIREKLLSDPRVR